VTYAGFPRRTWRGEPAGGLGECCYGVRFMAAHALQRRLARTHDASCPTGRERACGEQCCNRVGAVV